jgi:hypothetical protein
MGSASIPTSLKWIGLIVIYFFVLFIILGVVRSSVNYANAPELNYGNINAQCGLPRTFYSEDGLTNIQSNSDMSRKQYADINCNIWCKASKGATSEALCNSINGCSWSAVNNTPAFSSMGYWLCNIYDYLEFGQTICNPPDIITTTSCNGNIYTSYYGITTADYFGITYANQCLIESGTNQSSICSDVSVINNRTLCEMLSCTWLSRVSVMSLKSEDLRISQDIFANTFDSFKEIVTLQYTFFGSNSEQMNLDSTSNVWINGILSFFLFYIPTLLLLGAIYGLIPFV